MSGLLQEGDDKTDRITSWQGMENADAKIQG